MRSHLQAPGSFNNNIIKYFPKIIGAISLDADKKIYELYEPLKEIRYAVTKFQENYRGKPSRKGSEEWMI